MKTASSKSKGRALQKWVRDLLLNIYVNTLETDDIKSTSMGAQGVDVQLSPAAQKLIPYAIECKNYAQMAFYKWYEQAVLNTKPGLEPILVCKANRKKPVVIIDAEHFFREYRRVNVTVTQ